MTAVAGIWRFDTRPTANDECQRMLNALRIYGPDAQDQWSDGDIALGRNLMRVLPEDRFDRQPESGENGVRLVADVRIDNRSELASMLNIECAEEQLMSDSRLVFESYMKWGEDCFERLIGDYAIVIWDDGQRKLLLARDYAGMRPLYYHRSNNFLAFSSMPKGLHALPDVPYRANRGFITEYLALLPIGSSDHFYDDITSVEKGCFLRVTANGASTHRHWNPPQQDLKLSSHDEYAEALREVFDTAVLCRLRGATQVGAHLSAGLDSSAVAATAAELIAPSGGRVHAFTSVPRENYDRTGGDQRLHDEGELAAAVAQQYNNMDHHRINTEGRSPLDGLDRNFFLYDQPVRNLCNQSWMDALNDSAKSKKIGVMLTGVMGNFSLSFAGNELLSELLASGRVLEWMKEALHAKTYGRSSKQILHQSLGPWVPAPIMNYLRRQRGYPDLTAFNYALLNQDRLKDRDLEQVAKARGLNLSSRQFQTGRMAREMAMKQGSGGVMAKGVLAGWRIDTRDPTADKRLFDFCLTVPTNQFCYKGEPRALVRRAMSDRLPAGLLQSKKRGLQAADWHMGLREDFEQLTDTADRIGKNDLAAQSIDTDRLSKLIENWSNVDWQSKEASESYRFALLRGISTGDFLRRVSGSNN